MKVAIIGAGVAGLSCAHELERFGIEPVVYERNSYIGERMNHVSAFLEIMERPIKDQLEFIRNEYNISLKPLSTVNKLVHYSPNKKTELTGNFGYLMLRAKEELDIKRQIFSQLKNTNVLFNEAVEYEELCKVYDYVVVANGTNATANELGCWVEWLRAKAIGAVILGDFETDALHVWINLHYCRHGYAYMTPFNRKRASLWLVVPNVNEKEVEFYWQEFLRNENITNTIVEESKLEHTSGHVYPHRVENIFLAGNAGGAIEPFLGFGTLESIIMGAASARSIATGADYEALISEQIQKNKRLYEFRRTFNKIGNDGLDVLISLLGFPGVKQIGYQSPINVIEYGGKILKMINRHLE